MKQPYNTTIYNTALYMRLSRDDENYGDSVSIETQRTILQQYAKEQGLHVVGEYVDDGWSGTNFERPDFQRMMDDVEAGKVNCIVTKDLSRFGREHVMMDYYLEFLFPEKRVRYIAVAENEDTEKGLSDFVPFKNLFNEWFAKDTSRKVKAAFKAKFATVIGTISRNSNGLVAAQRAGRGVKAVRDSDLIVAECNIRKLRPRRGNSGIYHALRFVLQLPDGCILGGFGSGIRFGLAGERSFLPAECAGAGF